MKKIEQEFDLKIHRLSGKRLAGKSIFTHDEFIIRCDKGSASIAINSLVHQFDAGLNFFISDTEHLKIIDCSNDFSITVCKLSLHFFNEIYAALDNKVTDVLWYSAPDIYTHEQIAASNLLIENLCIISRNNNHSYRHKIIANLALCYLLEIYEITKDHIDIQAINTNNYAGQMIDKFFSLLSDNYLEHRNIEFYADKLNISSRYLYNITKDAFKATPKQAIDNYITGVAKRMLLTTTLTNQQIAYKMNFPDQATFGQFFKRNVGIPPSEFRSRYK